MITVLDCLTHGIIEVSSSGVIRLVNKGAKRIFPRLAQGLHISEVFGLKVVEVILAPVESETKNQKEFQIEHEHSLLKVTVNSLPQAFDGLLISLAQIENVAPAVHEQTQLNASFTLNDILGDSDPMCRLREQARTVAVGKSTILIRGESGTGKEMLARAIHSLSPRSNGPFVTINCSAIPEELLESELFGYDEGAFTGARRGGKIGKFELAHMGTLFLDEIGDMPLFLQAKLLRVLQEREVERIGGLAAIPVDVRIIAATHRDLEEMLKQGEFREDLFYRINVIPLQITPLRERKSDLTKLCNHFIESYNRQLHKNVLQVSEAFSRKLKDYSWPGNVRELQNAIEYAMNLADGMVLDQEHLPIRIRNFSGESKENIYDLESLERETIIRCINQFGHTVQGKERAAEALGIGLATLYRKLAAYGVTERKM